ncbi:hypothetical protein ACWDBW_09460 [Streptomyces sp. NPDC001107]
MKGVEVAPRSWELKSGDTALGVLFLVDIDQPWFRCEFKPGEGWAEFGQLFDAQAAAVDSTDDQRIVEAVGAVRDLPLKLHPLGEGETITPFII